MKLIFTLLSFLCIVQSFAQTTVSISDTDLQPGGSYYWTNDTVYILDGLVFLETGSTLDIEPGTVIKFTSRADVGNPSALVITRGAKIYAEGTVSNPIIFTAEADDVNDPSDLGPTDNALWGGIVLLCLLQSFILVLQ